MIAYHDRWPWTKPGYITMIRIQSNNQWSGGIAVHFTPKNSERKNPLENFSPRFFGIKTASSSLSIFQRAKLSTRCITYLCWCNWRTFWWKNIAVRSSRWSCSCTTIPPGSPGTCIPEETGLPGLPVSLSPTLFSGSSPVEQPPDPCTEKQLKGLHFSSKAEAIVAAETWLDVQPSGFFLSVLKMLEEGAKKFIELHGEYIE